MTTRLQEARVAFDKARVWEAMTSLKRERLFVEGERTGDYTAYELAVIEHAHAARALARTAKEVSDALDALVAGQDCVRG